jgi:hypothetical protein
VWCGSDCKGATGDGEYLLLVKLHLNFTQVLGRKARGGLHFLWCWSIPYLEDYDKVYHAYYQWVPLMFAMQAVIFHLQHFIWKMIG